MTSCVKTTRGYLTACNHPTFVKWHDLTFHNEILLQLANSFIRLLQLGQFPLLTVNMLVAQVKCSCCRVLCFICMNNVQPLLVLCVYGCVYMHWKKGTNNLWCVHTCMNVCVCVYIREIACLWLCVHALEKRNKQLMVCTHMHECVCVCVHT